MILAALIVYDLPAQDETDIDFLLMRGKPLSEVQEVPHSWVHP